MVVFNRIPKSKRQLVYLVLVFLLVIVLVGVGALYFHRQSPANSPDSGTGETNQNNTNDLDSTASQTEAQNAELAPKIKQGGVKTGEIVYEIRDTVDYKPGSDQHIVKRWWDGGAEELVVASTHSAIPELKQNPDLKLSLFGNRSIRESKLLLLTGKLNGPYQIFYSVDLATKQVSKMKVNDIITSPFWPGHFHIPGPAHAHSFYVPHPSATQGKDQKLYLIDFINDTYKLLVTLAGDETLNAGGLPGQEHYINVQIKGKSLQYGVYLQSLKQRGYNPWSDNGAKVLHAYRFVTITDKDLAEIDQR